MKKPKKDLDDDQLQHSSKAKKEPLSEALKYCGNILKELLSKKHAVSTFDFYDNFDNIMLILFCSVEHLFIAFPH